MWSWEYSETGVLSVSGIHTVKLELYLACESVKVFWRAAETSSNRQPHITFTLTLLKGADEKLTLTLPPLILDPLPHLKLNTQTITFPLASVWRCVDSMVLDKGMCTPLIPVFCFLFFSKLSWKNMFVMFVISDDLYLQGLQSSSLTASKPGLKKMVLSQQGPLPWLYWRTWSQATFTWWRFLHPTTWAMVRSLM